MLECVHDIYPVSFGFAELLRSIFFFSRSLLIPSETCLLILLNRIFTLSNDSLLVTSSPPVENVLRDLELMIAAQHYRNLVALLVSFTLQDLLTFASLGFSLHLHCLLDRGGRDDLSNLVLDAPGSGCSFDNPDNSLIESISLFESLFQRHRVVRLMLDRIASCASCNCGSSIFF